MSWKQGGFRTQNIKCSHIICVFFNMTSSACRFLRTNLHFAHLRRFWRTQEEMMKRAQTGISCWNEKFCLPLSYRSRLGEEICLPLCKGQVLQQQQANLYECDFVHSSEQDWPILMLYRGEETQLQTLVAAMQKRIASFCQINRRIEGISNNIPSFRLETCCWIQSIQADGSYSLFWEKIHHRILTWLEGMKLQRREKVPIKCNPIA